MQRIGRERSGSAGANLADVAQRWNSKHALKIRFVFSILISIGVLGFSACREEAKPGVVIKKPAGSQSSANTGKQLAPAYVYEVLSYVKKKGMAPDNFTGGRVFENRERRLPQRTASGATIGYREWDVHPKVRGQNRGAERLVTGSDQSAWYTANHYKSFIRLE